jgi:GWxTD domain-containing protein
MAHTDSLFQDAIRDTAATTVDQNIDRLKQVIRSDRRYAPAYHALARMYMSKNNVVDRQRALTHLKRALYLDPENQTYLTTLGELKWSQGFWYNAMNTYQEAHEVDTTDAETAFRIGYHAMQDFLKYTSMVDYEKLGEEVVKFEWGKFAEIDKTKAVDYYERSIANDPGYRDAYYQLALTHLEDGHPDRMIETSDSLLSRIPDDKYAHLYAGLGQQRLGQHKKAQLSFQKFMRRMDPEERTLMASTQMLRSENDTVSSDSVQANYWKSRDPLLLTDYNERLLDHYSRVAYASLRFSRPWKDIPGWQTDQGKLHIRYGHPITDVSQRPEMSRLSLSSHVTRWVYDGFTVSFVNGDGLDGFRFGDGFDQQRNYRTGSMGEFTRSIPSYFKDPYEAIKLKVPHLIARFREGDHTRLEIAYDVPRSLLAFADPAGGDIEVGLFIFDGDWNDKHRRTSKVSIGESVLDRDENPIGHRIARIKEGPHHVIVEIGNPAVPAIGFFREEGVQSEWRDSLDLSDLLLAKVIEPQRDIPRNRTDLRIVANPARTYRRTQRMQLYFEIYNLERNTFGETDFSVSYTIRSYPGTTIERDVFEPVRLVGSAKALEVQSQVEENEDDDQLDVSYTVPKRNQLSQSLEVSPGGDGEITVSSRYMGSTPDDFTYLEIDLGTLTPGFYEVAVAIRDLTVAARELDLRAHQTRSTVFRVIE